MTISTIYHIYIYPYHPCMIYLPNCPWLIFMVNVGKYTIRGCYGISKKSPTVGPTKERNPKKPEYLIALATYLGVH